MKITLKSLKAKKACANGIKWFKENFGKEADSKEIVKKLSDIKDNKRWMEWLFIVYKLNGLCEEWHDNGRLACRITYKTGERHGILERWYKDGQFECRERYKDGEEHGLSEWWFYTGKIACKINYKDGNLHGLCERFNIDGQLVSQENFKDGKLVKKEK